MRLREQSQDQLVQISGKIGTVKQFYRYCTFFQILSVCQPVRYEITQAYFQANDSTVTSPFWTEGNWQRWYVLNTPVVAAHEPALIYVNVFYNDSGG